MSSRDCWQHEVKVEKITDADPKEKYPLCVAGKNACPPEDCGGLDGFEDFKEAIMNSQHPEYARMLEWNGGPFDPAKVDLDTINKYGPKRSRLGS